MKLRIVVNFLIFLTAGSAFAMRFPRPLPSFVCPSYRAFAKEVDMVELIFIGSSRTQHLDMTTFEAEIARRGCEVKALNLGVAGMIGQEAELYLERLMSRRPKRLRWVIVEMGFRELNPAAHEQPAEDDAEAEWNRRMARRRLEAMQFTQRELWTATPEATWRSVRLGLRAGMDTAYFQKQLALTARRSSPVGIAYDYLELMRVVEEEIRPAVRDGEKEATVIPRISLEAYQEHLALIEEVNPFWDRELQAAFYRKQARRLRKRGVEVIYVIPPQAARGSLSNAREARTLLPDEEIWSFADPEEYPELFEYGNRLEHIHLNSRGNTHYARRLAERFAEYRQREDAGSDGE
jgi:hypothetical protein